MCKRQGTVQRGSPQQHNKSPSASKWTHEVFTAERTHPRQRQELGEMCARVQMNMPLNK